MFWIVAAAVAVLIAIAIGVYLKGQRAELDDALSPEAGEVPAEQVPTPAPPPPRPTPRQMTPIVPPKVPAAPQEAVAPAPPPPTESPVVVRPAGPTPEEKAAALVARARSELADGRPADAKQSLETALEMDPDNADAKRLLDTAEARIRAAQRAPAPKPAPRPRRTTVSTAPATPAPAPKPAAPAMSDAERNAKVGDLIKAGRSAYNSGDYKTAISQYNQALKLDPGNALVKKLLAQAQAKSAE